MGRARPPRGSGTTAAAASPIAWRRLPRLNSVSASAGWREWHASSRALASSYRPRAVRWAPNPLSVSVSSGVWRSASRKIGLRLVRPANPLEQAGTVEARARPLGRAFDGRLIVGHRGVGATQRGELGGQDFDDFGAVGIEALRPFDRRQRLVVAAEPGQGDAGVELRLRQRGIDLDGGAETRRAACW